LNIQAADLGDLTGSYQRVKELGFGMALGFGQHTNDKELSYYAMTPSGFRMGGRLESDRRRRKHLATHDVSRHQHLGPYPGWTDNHALAGAAVPDN
jgi:hypothetical protein